MCLRGNGGACTRDARAGCAGGSGANASGGSSRRAAGSAPADPGRAGAAAGRGAGRLLGGSGQQRRERGRKCVLVRSSRFLEARSAFGFFEPRRFFEACSAFGGFIPCVVVLAFGVVSCSVVFDIGLVWQLAYNGDHGCKDQCVCAAAPEPAKTQQQKTVSDRKQCVQ